MSAAQAAYTAIQTDTFTAPDIECDGCANAIKKALGKNEGVRDVQVDIPTKGVTVHYAAPASKAQIVAALDRAGFPVG